MIVAGKILTAKDREGRAKKRRDSPTIRNASEHKKLTPRCVSSGRTTQETDCFFRCLSFASAIPARPEPINRSEVGSGTTEALPVRVALTP